MAIVAPALARPRAKHIKSGDWRLQILSRVNEMRADISEHPPVTLAPGFVQEYILDPLDRAQYLATKDRQDFWELLTGAQIEAAWQAVRSAKEAILLTTPNNREVVLRHAEQARSDGRDRLSSTHPVLQSLEAELGKNPPPIPAIRQLTVQVNKLAHEISDTEHREQRKFQNQLRLIATVIMAIALTIVIVLLLVGNETKDLLPAPTGVTTGVAALIALVCGALGALLTAVPSLSSFPGATTSPYSPIREQAGLKIAIGALSGILGPILITAGLTFSSDDTKTAALKASTMAGFVMLTALCGAQQEAISRFADRKANDLTPKTT